MRCDYGVHFEILSPRGRRPGRAVLARGIIGRGGGAMKLAAAVVVAAALVLPAAQAAARKGAQPVLGFDVAKNGFYRLAWFDPMALERLRGREARLGQSTGSWAFSPDRSGLAISVSQAAGRQAVY